MIKKYLQEGFILKSKGFYKYAIESFYKALEIDNSSLELLLEIADCYYCMKEEERALSYIEKILEKDPKHIDSLKLLKNIFVDKGAWTEAEQTTKNIYSISQNPEDLAEIFEFLNKQKRYNEIFEYKLDIESDSILYQKAYAKMFLNELEEAEFYIDKALSFNNNDKNLILKAKISFKNDNKDGCTEILNNLQIDENNSDTLNFIGLVKQYECDYSSALKYFLKATKISPYNDELFYNCASTYFKIGDIQNAKKYYNLAISLAPDNQNYHFALANLYYSEKHYKRAMEELNYDFFEAKLLKSIILYDSGYLALARNELEKLEKEQPNNDLIIDYKNRIENELKI